MWIQIANEFQPILFAGSGLEAYHCTVISLAKVVLVLGKETKLVKGHYEFFCSVAPVKIASLDTSIGKLHLILNLVPILS